MLFQKEAEWLCSWCVDRGRAGVYAVAWLVSLVIWRVFAHDFVVGWEFKWYLNTSYLHGKARRKDRMRYRDPKLVKCRGLMT